MRSGWRFEALAGMNFAHGHGRLPHGDVSMRKNATIQRFQRYRRGDLSPESGSGRHAGFHFAQAGKGRLLVALFLVVFSIAGTSQPSFQVKHYTRTDYQAGRQNWSIDTDRDGRVYVANNDGLLIYDGTGWGIFRIPGQSIVRAVYVATDGKIYTGSYESFGCWQKKPDGSYAYKALNPPGMDSLFHNSEFWKIVECNRKIYFQGFSALFVYDGKQVKPVALPGTVLFLLKARNRLFFQTIGGGVHEISGDRIIPVPGSQSLAQTEVKTILPFGTSDFLIGTTSDGLFRFDGRNVTPWNIPATQLLRNYQINNGLVNGDRLVFGTIVKGLFILDMKGNVIHHLHEGNALQNNTVLSLSAGSDGSLWAGLDKGIDHIYADGPLDIYQPAGTDLGAVYTAVLKGNTLYVGTNRGVLLFDQDDTTASFKYRGFLNGSQGQVWDLRLVNGTLFCGHTTGTYLIEDDRFRKISGISGGFCLTRLYTDNPDYLVQGTYSSLAVYRRSARNWEYLKEIRGFIEPSRFLESDHLGNLWAGHATRGLYRLRLSDNSDSVLLKVRYGPHEGLTWNSIGVTRINNRIVFTTGVRLFTWDDLNKIIIPYETLNQGLNGFESAVRIIPQGKDAWWFIRRDDLALFSLAGDRPRMLEHIFLPMFGIRMVDNYENAVPLDDNRLLVCLDEGFAIVDRNKMNPSRTQKLRLIFRNIDMIDPSGEHHPVDPSLTGINIPYSRNSVSISFSAVNSLMPNQLYQYSMAGIDAGWSEWSPKNKVTYSRLPAGKYTFRVRTLTGSGNLNETLTLDFTVKPAWYAGTMAWVAYAMAAIAIAVWMRYLVRRRLIRHHERLRREDEARMALEKQRTEQEIIRLQNEKLQAEVAHKNIQLADSTMAIIRKNELLIGIKEELDRQRSKLGEGYPQRYFERLMAMINKNISDDNDWKIFEALFDQAHENFFKRLKDAFPDLTQSDLRLCAFLKLNLSSKEIAPLLNISFRGVETRRYRLRRRLSLESDENLVEFIMQF
jgi:hypothetical protein